MAVRRPTAINPDSFPRGRGPRSSCPALNEEVLLADNKWIPAQDLKVGDEVATHLGSNKVTHIDVLKDRVKKEVVFSDNDQEESIVTSDSHPYYVQNEEGFVEVKNLKVGDQVGNFKVKEIKDTDKGSVVHISIDQAQTYYLKAGDKKVLSHNKRFLPPKEQTIEGIPISQLPFNPRMPGKPFPRRPKSKKRGGFGGGFGNLRNLIRRLKKQRDMGMPRRPSMDDGRFYAGGSPGLYKPGGRFYNPEARLKMPQPIARKDPSALERLPMGEAPSFNPTIFGQPIGDMDFSQMPKVSPEDMMNLQVPTEAPVMPMTQDLPEVAPVGMMGGRTLQQDFPAERRMMMAEGDEADSDDFPDLSGDGETTFKDVLIGRGVDLKAEGGEMMTQENEIDAMLGGMDSEVEGAMESMEELEQMAPEMEMIDQLVTMVVQMIQQGASEEEVMMFLKEQGLDDEDIGIILQLVAEMAEAEAMPQDGIDAELEQLA